MKCPKCQHENTAKARFCEECATPLTRSCGNCGSQVSSTARFCLQCGHPLKAVEEDPRYASPKNYTPQHIADKILVSRAALEGERKLITVLFADIKGSMEVIADRDPEEVQKLLHAVLERMIEAVHRYARGIPRVVNLLCEHALISAFVDQKRPVQVGAIDEVAREFDLHRIDPISQPVEQAGASGENASLMEALQNLATLVDRLRRPS
jgi:hypothetical protein